MIGVDSKHEEEEQRRIGVIEPAVVNAIPLAEVADIMSLKWSEKADIVHLERLEKTTVPNIVPLERLEKNSVSFERKKKATVPDIVHLERLEKATVADIVPLERATVPDIVHLERLKKATVPDIVPLERLEKDIVSLERLEMATVADIVPLEPLEKATVALYKVNVDHSDRSEMCSSDNETAGNIIEDLVVADYEEVRSGIVPSELERYGAEEKSWNVKIADAGVDMVAGCFDTMVIVIPCSGTLTVRFEDDVKWSSVSFVTLGRTPVYSGYFWQEGRRNTDLVYRYALENSLSKEKWVHVEAVPVIDSWGSKPPERDKNAID